MRSLRAPLVCATIVFTLWGATPAQAQLTPEQVNRSIHRGVEYLKVKQSHNGTWVGWPGNPGGSNALCDLALLHAGVPPNDEHMVRALTYLRRYPAKDTYTVSLVTMVFCAAKEEQDLGRVRDYAKLLVKYQNSDGGWGYNRGNLSSKSDNSNTQFALLALHEAERFDPTLQIEERVWQKSLNYWLGCQNRDGSWGYRYDNRTGTASMTCAGISSVVISSRRLRDRDINLSGGQLECCGQRPDNQAVERALTWLGNNFSVVRNNGAQDKVGGLRHWLYYLYGLERAGRLSARRHIVGNRIGSKPHDWYREGVDQLVRKQDNVSGFWQGAKDFEVGSVENIPTIATSLSLLFLAKGRRPLLLGKVRHGPVDDWNNHPDDVANLTHYVEQKWERDLTWQVVDLDEANVDELLQIPVLFISGQQAPQFTPAEINALAQYVKGGGLIFAEACCQGDSLGFDEGFRRLVKQMLGEQGTLVRLGPDHPIWRMEEQVSEHYVGHLYGVTVSCRVGIIYCDRDLSCRWQHATPRRMHLLEAQAPKIAREIDSANAVGINVLHYATNRELKYKYEHFNTSADLPQDRLNRGQLFIAKLKHSGGSDDAPGALPNLQRALAKTKKLRIGFEPLQLKLTDEKVFDFPVLFMHGRHAFHFSDVERQQLRTFVERGGFLLADSICGSAPFIESFRAEMRKTFAGQGLQAIPSDHPLFGTEFGGYELKTVRLRQKQEGQTAETFEQTKPHLEGIKVGERYGVIFSPYDISCALENHATLDCRGYHSEDALKIGVNAVLYSLYQPGP